MNKEVKEVKTESLTKRILILSNLSEEKIYKDTIRRKKDLFDQCKQYCEQFIEIKGLKALTEFNESFTNHFKKSFLDKHRSDFPLIVNDTKIFEISDVQLHKIEHYENAYKTIELEDFDYIKGTAKAKDFGVYAETPDQIERYYKTISVIEHLNNLRDLITQGTIIRSQIAKAIRVISFDANKNTFKLNVEYILKGF